MNLHSYPIFTDEAMYLNWGRLIWENPFKYLFFSLTDGQQPFFIWLTAISWKLSEQFYFLAEIFPQEVIDLLTNVQIPLVMGRLISVFSGLGTIFVLYAIGEKLSKPLMGAIAALLYTVSPFAFWYDRLAIKDSFLLFLGVYLFYLTMAKLTSARSLLIGIILGIALLTKSIAYFYLVLIIITLLIFNLARRSITDDALVLQMPVKSLIRNCLFILFISVGISQIMRLSQDYGMISQKNGYFVRPLGELILWPFELLPDNLFQLKEWLLTYISLPVIFAAVSGFILMLFRKTRFAFVLAIWFLLPLTYELLMAKVFFPRYILFILLPTFVFSAYALWSLFEINFFERLSFLKPLILIILLIPNILSIIKFSQDPTTAPFATIDRWQYVEGWPSGYGMSEMISYINKQFLKPDKDSSICLNQLKCLNDNVPLNFIVEDITLVPAALAMEYADLTNVYVNIDIPKESDIFPENSIKEEMTNLVIISNLDYVPSRWPLELISEFRKPGGKSSIRLYLVKQLN